MAPKSTNEAGGSGRRKSAANSAAKRKSNGNGSTPGVAAVEADHVAAPGTTTAPAESIEPPPSRPGASFSLLHVLAVVIFHAAIVGVTLWSHYKLPSPREMTVENMAAPAHFSEVEAMKHIEHLSSDIGYRIVGTSQHVEAERWLESVVKQYDGWHRTVEDDDQAGNVTRDARGDTQVEIWTQIGNGNHRFDFMGAYVFKQYFQMSNVIVRISDGTDAGKEHAVLLNSHLDSTLPSPGAADDGAGVSIMLELLRIYTTAPRPRLRHSVILLFNNGEESLQDASHLYITQHNETRNSVRMAVNLEACGVSGPELLFQAGSIEAINAYSKVPRPYGTVLAQDVFSSGIVLSDTDYRQFVQYGDNLSGLDMAIVGSSQLYHTRRDVVENIKPGVIQHFGENIVALTDYLVTSPQSRLATNRPFNKHTAPIYFSIASRFFVLISANAYKRAVMVLAALTNFHLTTFGRADKHFGAIKNMVFSLLFTVASMIAALVGSNVVALIMTQIIGKPLSWFTHEELPILLYGPPALTAIFLTQYAFSAITNFEQKAFLERASLDGLSMFFSIGLIILNAFSIGSSYLSALGSVAMIVVIFFNDLVMIGMTSIEMKQVAGHRRVHPFSYFLMTIVPASVGGEGLCSFLDLFTPLTGRTGADAPADHILASITGALSFLCLPFVIPLAHRMGPARLKNVILLFAAISVASIAFFASPALPIFSESAPKRLFVHQVENITSGSWSLHLGGADPDVKGLKQIATDIHSQFGNRGEPPTPEIMSESTAFDIIYPVSNFLTSHVLDIPTPASSLSPWSYSDSGSMEPFYPYASEDEYDWEKGTRRVTITVDRPSIIWSVLAFEAEVLEWNLDVNPPKGLQRHWLKEVSRHGQDNWSVTMLIKLPQAALDAYAADSAAFTASLNRKQNSHVIREAEGIPERHPAKLWIDYSGLIAEAMWPQAKSLSSEQQKRYPSLEILQRLDEYLLRTRPDVDSMLLSVVAAVSQV